MSNSNLKVLISSRSFGKINSDAIDLLKKQGLIPILNPHGRKLNEDEILSLIDSDVVGIIVGTENITRKIINNASSLKVISRYGIGLENIDINTANQKGVMVFNTPETPVVAVAELALSLILNILKKINKLDREIRGYKWKCEIGNLLSGKKVGIIGLGRIGKKLVKFLQPFNVEIFAYDINPDNEFVSKYNINLLKFDELLSHCDIITLHCPLTEETKNLIGEKELSNMNKETIIINTARGKLIDENALYNALKNKQIAGAAIDAFEDEPYKGKLIELENVILTPHIGTATFETRLEMEKEASNKLIQGLKQQKII